MKVKTYVNLLLDNMLKLIVYLIRMMKINQLQLQLQGTITVAGNTPRDRQDRPVILINNAPFIFFIARINGELIEDADDLDIVIPMCNLLEYSKNYRKTTGS